MTFQKIVTEFVLRCLLTLKNETTFEIFMSAIGFRGEYEYSSIGSTENKRGASMTTLSNLIEKCPDFIIFYFEHCGLK